MDIYRIASDLKYANQIGVTLSVHERLALLISI
jgi:hypothetical protein